MGAGAGVPLQILFPRLCRTESNKESSVKDDFEWNRDGVSVSWELSVRRVIRQSKSGGDNNLC